MTRRAVGGLGASPEEAFVVLEHTIRGVGGFTGSEHHKKKCWYLWNITRREVGGFEASHEEVLVPLEHHTKSCKKKCLQTLEHHSFGASPEEAVVVLKHFWGFVVDTRVTTTEHSCACHTRAPTMPRDGTGQDGQDRTGQDRTRARGGSKANTKTMPSADFEASDEIA